MLGAALDLAAAVEKSEASSRLPGSAILAPFEGI